MDEKWVVAYLDESLELIRALLNHEDVDHDEVVGRLPSLKLIMERTLDIDDMPPEMRFPSRTVEWGEIRQACVKARHVVERGAEIREKLDDPGPQMTAAALHPQVWDAAKSLWSSRHYRDAVQAAAKSVNAQIQDKLSRRDVSEKDAVRAAFSLSAPEPGAPRLRLMADDGSDTYRSLHEGAGHFGAGCFQALRNPDAHEAATDERPEQEALERLAAFSVLARWIDEATIEEASP